MIFGFLLTALYVPGIAGAATTPKWALLAVALPVLLLMRGDSPRKFTLSHLFGLGFVAWAAVSLIWTPNRLDGMGELIKLVILTQVFLLGARMEPHHLSSLLCGLAIGLLPSAAVVLIQTWQPDIVLHATPNSGLFVNSGSLAEIAALVMIGLLTIQGRYWQGLLFMLLLPCLILPMSRGAYLASLRSRSCNSGRNIDLPRHRS